MKNKHFFNSGVYKANSQTKSLRLLAIALVAIIGFSVSIAGCDNGTTDTHTHQWGEWTVTTPATCEAAGEETRTCTLDPAHKETRPIAAAHQWGAWTVTKAATTLEGGEETRTCTLDPTHKETRPIAKITEADFYGTYKRTLPGILGPFTITITAANFRFVDKNGNEVNHADIAWIPEQNTATDGSPDDNGSELTPSELMPKEQYPSGYTINGNRTAPSYHGAILPVGIFIALSADKQALYIGKSASVYGSAGGTVNPSYMWSDSIFTRVEE